MLAKKRWFSYIKNEENTQSKSSKARENLVNCGLHVEKSNKTQLPRFIIAISGVGVGHVSHQILNGRIWPGNSVRGLELQVILMFM